MSYPMRSEASKIKYFKRLGIYKNSTGNVVFDPVKLEARSYDHWVFVKKIRGKLVFNDYNYSQSTNAHQSLVRGVLRDLKIKIDAVVYTHDDLDCLESSGIRSVYKRFLVLQAAVKNPKARKDSRAHQWRVQEFNEAKKNLATLRSIGVRASRRMQAELKAQLAAETKQHAAEAARVREENRIKRQENSALVKEQKVFNIFSLAN